VYDSFLKENGVHQAAGAGRAGANEDEPHPSTTQTLENVQKGRNSDGDR
jgi:hypothetical protein